MVTRSRAGDAGRDVVDHGVRRDRQLDAALARLGGLAQQQRGEHRLGDGADDPVGELLGEREFGGRELDGLLGSADLDQGNDGVQPVRRLVRLRPQRLGEAAGGGQLAGQRLQFRVVAQGRRRCPASGPPERTAVVLTTSTRCAGQVQLVGAGSRADVNASRQRVRQAQRRPASRPTGSASGRGASRAAVVAQADPPVAVDEQQALRGPSAAPPRGTRRCGSARPAPSPWVWRRSRALTSQPPSAADQQRRAARRRTARPAAVRAARP